MPTYRHRETLKASGSLELGAAGFLPVGRRGARVVRP
jgi:hypothetical protein